MVDMGSDENAAGPVDLSRVVNALPALVWTTQGDGRSDFVNRSWCEYTGLGPEAARDHGWQSAIHPDDLSSLSDRFSAIQQSGVATEIEGRLRRFLQWSTSGIIHVDDFAKQKKAVRNLLTTGEMFDEQIRMLYPTGDYRWTRARAVPIRNAHGSIVRYVTFQIDVDDPKRAQDLLAAEVKLLERMARGGPLSQVLDALSRHVQDLCRDCFCNILLVAADRTHFETYAGPSQPDAVNGLLDRSGIDRGGCDPYSKACIEKTLIIAGDLANDSRWEGSAWPAKMKTHGYRSCWAMPIMAGSGETSGVIAIHRREPAHPTTQQQDLVDRFAKIAGIAIDRARAEEALSQARLESTHVARLATLSAMTASITHEMSQPISGILNPEFAAECSRRGGRHRESTENAPSSDADAWQRHHQTVGSGFRCRLGSSWYRQAVRSVPHHQSERFGHRSGDQPFNHRES